MVENDKSMSDQISSELPVHLQSLFDRSCEMLSENSLIYWYSNFPYIKFKVLEFKILILEVVFWEKWLQNLHWWWFIALILF